MCVCVCARGDVCSVHLLLLESVVSSPVKMYRRHAMRGTVGLGMLSRAHSHNHTQAHTQPHTQPHTHYFHPVRPSSESESEYTGLAVCGCLSGFRPVTVTVSVRVASYTTVPTVNNGWPAGGTNTQ